MINLIKILTLTLTLISSFFGLSKIARRLLGLKLSKSSGLLVGFVWFMGNVQFFSYLFVYFKNSNFFYYSLFILFFVIGLITNLVEINNNLRKNYLGIRKNLVNFGALLIVSLPIFIVIYNRTLGQNSFDYLHYLSMIQEGSTHSIFGFLDYGTGYQTSVINPQYDFQSYYHFGSFILFGFNRLIKFFATDYFPVSMHLVIWTLSIIFVLLNISLINEIVSKIKSSVAVKVFIYLIFVFYFGFMYYNSSYAFFGNSYRSILVSYFIYEIYRSLNNPHKSLKNSVWLMLISSAVISVSSSGFFIGIVVLTPYILIILRKSIAAKEKLKHVLILTVPTVLFSAFYLSANQQASLPWLILGASIIYGISTLFILSENTIINLILEWIMKLVLYAVPVLIICYGLYAFILGRALSVPFFYDHRAYDMVWYLFNNKEVFPLIINLIFFSALLYFVLRDKTDFKKYLTIVIALFINPLSAYFLSDVLASVVYYRSFEVVFNATSYLIVLSYLMEHSILRNKLKVQFALPFVAVIFTIIAAFQVYHVSFIPSDNFNGLYRIEETKIDMLNILNTKMILEKYESAKVVSQIEEVRAYVPNVITPISNEAIRNVDKYLINTETSKLLTIFMNRDYIGQVIFDQEPQYDQTCSLLIESRIDFVIVSKNQFLIDDIGEIIPLYFKVRDCADLVYENSGYMLYQFYW